LCEEKVSPKEVPLSEEWKQHYIGKDPKYTVKSSGQESLVHPSCIGIGYANAMRIKKLPPAAHDLHFPNLRT
jgi:hypothetical protein